MTNMTIAIIIGWVLCGTCAYGITLGYFENKWKHLGVRSEHDKVFSPLKFTPPNNTGIVLMSLFYGAMGPIGAILSFFLSERGKYGLLWKPLDPEG